MKGRLILALSMFALVLSFTVGCGSREEGTNAPMDAPLQLDAPHSGGPVVQGLLDGAIIGPILNSVTGVGDQLGRVQSVVTTVSRLINGLLGGKVQNGRYKLEFQPGSFKGLLNISIVDLGRERPGCDFPGRRAF